ncbi:winged helix-turn-helix domain-containing protein [Methylorubrum aminovorans]
MEAALAGGLSYGEIAAREGLSVGAVSRHARELGLRSTRCGAQPEPVTAGLVARVAAGEASVAAAAAFAGVSEAGFLAGARRHGVCLPAPRRAPAPRVPNRTLGPVLTGRLSLAAALAREVAHDRA